MMALNTSTELSGAPLRVLLDSLGLLKTLRVSFGVARRRLRDRPFASLGPAGDRREKQSRRQALVAILLYRELQVVVPDRALALTFRVIEAGAVGYLRRTLGRIRGDALMRLAPETRAKRVQGWLDRFFTATATLDRVTESKVEFTVTACALVRLSHAAGHPELAPAFCRGDA